MSDLVHQKCVPCSGKEPVLTAEEIDRYHGQVPDWKVIEVNGEKRLQRVYSFPNFSAALDFTNRVGQAADAEDHHPAILTEWGKVTLSWWTHKIHGLHQNDFIMAAKSDQLYRS